MMEKPKRRFVEPVYSMCVQLSFIIGTNNEDVTQHRETAREHR